MKAKVLTIFVVVIMVLMAGCTRSATKASTGFPVEGPPGPQGETGPAGPQGESGFDGLDGLDGKDFDPYDPEFRAILDQVVAEQIALAQPVATQAPILEPTGASQSVSTEVPSTNVQASSDDWTLTWYATADKDRGDGTTFKQDAEKWNWRKIAPELWPTFPNVPNPLVPDFRVVKCADDPTNDCVPDGLEYANAESNFCQQLAGEACRVPVAAQHYLYFTGDYDVPSIGSCKGTKEGQGCMLVIVNVGKVTSDFTGVFNQGFRLHARYWNGDALDMAMWALTSQGSNVMMNLDSPLNPNRIANAGANCSVPGGCLGVNVRVVFVSGNEPMLMLETNTSR